MAAIYQPSTASVSRQPVNRQQIGSSATGAGGPSLFTLLPNSFPQGRGYAVSMAPALGERDTGTPELCSGVPVSLCSHVVKLKLATKLGVSVTRHLVRRDQTSS